MTADDRATVFVYCDPDLGDGPGHNSHHARAVLSAALQRGLATVAVVNVVDLRRVVSADVGRGYTYRHALSHPRRPDHDRNCSTRCD